MSQRAENLVQRLRIVSLMVLSFLILILAYDVARAQGSYQPPAHFHEDHSQLRGPHPMPGQHDPYGKAYSIPQADGNRFNCCHGQDCSEYKGPPPVRVQRDGTWGYLFADKWFVEESRRIDVNTLDDEVKGIPILCISRWGQPLCWHWPTNG